MTRRPKGTGTYFRYKRTGKWCGQITVNGVTFTTYGATKPECEAACQAWAVEQRKRPRTPDRAAVVTLGHYLQRWIQGVNLALEPNTRRAYIWAIERLPHQLLERPLAAVDRPSVQAAFTELADTLSAASLQLMRTVLRRAMREACDTGLVSENPVQRIAIPRMATPETRAWTIAESQRFLETVDLHPWRALWWLVLATGLRNGEVRALRWEDVNLQTGIIRVRRKINEEAERVGQPKQHRLRTVVVRGPALRALAEWRQEQTARSGYVFSEPNGDPITGYHLRAEFQKFTKAAGLPPLTFHGLRHTAITAMLQAGLPVHVVSRVAGHSRPSITTDIYAHVLAGDAESAADVMAQLLGEAKSSKETA